MVNFSSAPSTATQEKWGEPGTDDTTCAIGLFKNSVPFVPATMRFFFCSPSAPRFPFLGTGRGRTEEVTEWLNYFAICGTVCEIWHRAGVAVFS